VTGRREHSTTVQCEHGRRYDLYLRAADVNGNATASSAVVSFDVDTGKVLLNWTARGTTIPPGRAAPLRLGTTRAARIISGGVVTIQDLAAIGA